MSSNGPPPGIWYRPAITDPPTSPPPPPPKGRAADRERQLSLNDSCDNGLWWLALAWILFGGSR